MVKRGMKEMGDSMGIFESKKRTIHIICNRFYNFQTKKIEIGGVETYLLNLLPIFVEHGFECRIYQFSTTKESCSILGYKVNGVGNSEVDGKKNLKILLKAAEDNIDNEKDVLLFADHWMTIENHVKNSLSIQHGIHWDIPKKQPRNVYRMIASGAKFTLSEAKKLSYVNRVVCVDYNFPNWYRAQVDRAKAQMVVIPNFSIVIEKNFEQLKSHDKVNIIFARRLVEFRGTRIFANVAKRLLEQYDNIAITIAGSGPDERYMHDVLDVYNGRVHFTQYTADQSLMIHEDKDIAVIPTVGSEGTSLSLLEAMASKCAVVCTSVGGMTNIVLDNYNGLMVEPGNENQLIEALVSLIDNESKRKALAERGYDTVKNAFSYERWKEKWSKIIAEL